MIWIPIIFLLTMLLGVPIMAVLGMTSIIPSELYNIMQPTFIAQSMFTGVNQIVLIAVAGFIFAGMLMEKCGITDGILDFARVAVGRMPGGYAIMCIVASTFFAALTGAGPACTAAIGSLTIPLMLGAGYDKGFTSSVAAAGGTLGVMIPPSNPMIIYAMIATLSVSDLFLAGIVPGLITAVLLCLLCYTIAKRRGYYTAESGRFSWKELAIGTWKARWGIIAPILILGSIYSGITTPTESAIIASLYALLVGIFRRSVTFADVVDALKRTAVMTGSILSMVGIATVFARMLTLYGVPQAVANAFKSLTNNAIIMQILIMLLMLFVGMWLDTTASLIVMVPIFLPLIKEMGISPIAFGIELVLSVQIAFITPPFAVNLFVVCKMTKLPLAEVSKDVLPFIGVLLIVSLLIIFFPFLSTCLL